MSLSSLHDGQLYQLRRMTRIPTSRGILIIARDLLLDFWMLTPPFSALPLQKRKWHVFNYYAPIYLKKFHHTSQSKSNRYTRAKQIRALLFA